MSYTEAAASNCAGLGSAGVIRGGLWSADGGGSAAIRKSRQFDSVCELLTVLQL